jgi:hypothetical protein
MPYIFGIAVILLLLYFYRVISHIYIVRLQRMLENGDLSLFLEVLGPRHKMRQLANGIERYKWKKGWITIRADFDEKGKLVSTKQEYDEKFSLLTNYFFTKEA